MTDTTTMTGAQFKRHVGTDPVKWAEAFIRSTAGEMREAEILERAAHVAPWFRDAMEAAARAESLKTLASLSVQHREVEPLTPVENTTLREVLAGLRIALAAHERGDAEHVSQSLRLKIKQLSFGLGEPPSQ